MQDRYAGDIGDFLKFGLLRWLTAAAGGEPALSLGVLWYRTPDESHNQDGKHVAYLEPDHATGAALRSLDEDLHDRLRAVLMFGRSIAEVQRSGALPSGTAFFDDPLTFDAIADDRSVRETQRSTWLQRALDELAGCDIVFADPDNGIRPATHREPRHRDRSIKHAYVDELAEFAQRGQSVVAYHHADRSAAVPVQAQSRMSELLAGGLSPIAAVRASRGTTRLFLVCGDGAIGQHLETRLVDLEASPWRTQLDVIWRAPDAPATAVEETPARPITNRGLSDECQRLTNEVLAASPEVHTIADGRLNVIIDVLPAGVLVHTEKSRRAGEPKLVPGWMIDVAWDHLRRTGRLTQKHLVATDGLNIKRSAFVMALLAHFPGVEVISRSPSELDFSIAAR